MSGLSSKFRKERRADFMAKSPWAGDGSMQPIELKAGTAHEFSLAPFQVLTLEAIPAAK